jgi:D-inositol-3-phosphate glycosyltransferase
MIRRVAFLSIHSSPLASPGVGDAGGMNVYIDALARTLAGRDIRVDVFTRRGEDRAPDETEVAPGYCVIQIDADGEDRADLVGSFAEGVAKWIAEQDAMPDILHSHYWLSGWAGAVLQDALTIPLAISFHTLGRVKEATRAPGEPRESLVRLAAETEVVARAGCVVASTPAEAADLIEHYQANPERICVSPPGVDHSVFRPGNKERARARLGLESGSLVAFVGRIQPLKGVDVAIEAVAAIEGVRLLVVGGPSGPVGELELTRLQALAALRAPGRVTFMAPRPHADIACVYRAADAVIVPSRSESFGLVAVEAQASGTPVVASRVGGLAYSVADDQSGYLIAGHDPADYATALRRILDDPATAERLSAGALDHAAAFSWDATADRLIELYNGLVE